MEIYRFPNTSAKMKEKNPRFCVRTVHNGIM